MLGLLSLFRLLLLLSFVEVLFCYYFFDRYLIIWFLFFSLLFLFICYFVGSNHLKKQFLQAKIQFFNLDKTHQSFTRLVNSMKLGSEQLIIVADKAPNAIVFHAIGIGNCLIVTTALLDLCTEAEQLTLVYRLKSFVIHRFGLVAAVLAGMSEILGSIVVKLLMISSFYKYTVMVLDLQAVKLGANVDDLSAMLEKSQGQALQISNEWIKSNPGLIWTALLPVKTKTVIYDTHPTIENRINRLLSIANSIKKS